MLLHIYIYKRETTTDKINILVKKIKHKLKASCEQEHQSGTKRHIQVEAVQNYTLIVITNVVEGKKEKIPKKELKQQTTQHI